MGCPGRRCIMAGWAGMNATGWPGWRIIPTGPLISPGSWMRRLRRIPGGGPRRLGFELGRAKVSPLPSRSTIYRVLVRHQLVPARTRKRRRQDYKRWQREEPMQLWQLDVTGLVFLADGTELKLISGIDDHSRFCVIAAVVRRATARAVCRAFLAAMAVPALILPDSAATGSCVFTRPMRGSTTCACRRLPRGTGSFPSRHQRHAV